MSYAGPITSALGGFGADEYPSAAETACWESGGWWNANAQICEVAGPAVCRQAGGRWDPDTQRCYPWRQGGGGGGGHLDSQGNVSAYAGPLIALGLLGGVYYLFRK